MTVICFKNRVLAADTRITEDGTAYGSMRKITTSNYDDSLAGACGGASSISAFLRWCHGGRRGRKPAVDGDKDFCGMHINADSMVTLYECDMNPYVITSDFHAIGSGMNTALGAMAAGADAIRAVRIACRFITSCGEPIHALRLDGEPHRLNPSA